MIVCQRGRQVNVQVTRLQASGQASLQQIVQSLEGLARFATHFRDSVSPPFVRRPRAQSRQRCPNQKEEDDESTTLDCDWLGRGVERHGRYRRRARLLHYWRGRRVVVAGSASRQRYGRAARQL